MGVIIHEAILAQIGSDEIAEKIVLLQKKMEEDQDLKERCLNKHLLGPFALVNAQRYFVFLPTGLKRSTSTLVQKYVDELMTILKTPVDIHESSEFVQVRFGDDFGKAQIVEDSYEIHCPLDNLGDLIGLKLADSSRAADMECLKFGEKLVTGDYEYALHVQCPWRFCLNGKEQNLSEILKQVPKIISVEVRDLGHFTLQFENNLQLIVTPEPTDEEGYEYWRLLDNKKKKHTVVTVEGVEEF